jgi:hypothetical protein
MKAHANAVENLVVFLTLDVATRIERLQQREMQRFGRIDPTFLTWAAQYDDGPPVGRSLAKHRAWLARRRCPVLELHGDLSVDARVDAVRRAVDALAGALDGDPRRPAPRLT